MNPELFSTESTVASPVGTSVSPDTAQSPAPQQVEEEDKNKLFKNIGYNILVLLVWCIIAVILYYVFLRPPTNHAVPRGKPYCDYPESIGKPIYSSKPLIINIFT